ncbi:5'/3'-nucleotidase SurE [Roseivirga sp.]|uniref:5'/3'-nucleotidase SurE n=1 Tax=Roseivirga sp. TaxID=1964215 RepID=UPI002B2688CF|nr:5'/3'-nucleotidase SurE [Roseivirga sp.]
MKCFKNITLIILLLCITRVAVGQNYRILISNDDGIQSPLISTLKTEIEKLPNVEVIVAAPAQNQSGSSQSTNTGPLEVEKIFKGDQFLGYAVNGRPADAVRFGIRILGKDKPFDLVISGINSGSNVGNLSHLSGTVGAAMEGLYHGIPAIAVSQESRGVNTEATSRFIAQLVAKYQNEGAPKGVVLSVNIPAGELKGIMVKPMGDAYLDMGNYELISETDNKMVYNQRIGFVRSQNEQTDTYAYQNGYVTITPIKFDWTAYELMGSISNWGLKLENK